MTNGEYAHRVLFEVEEHTVIPDAQSKASGESALQADQIAAAGLRKMGHALESIR